MSKYTRAPASAATGCAVRRRTLLRGDLASRPDECIILKARARERYLARAKTSDLRIAWRLHSNIARLWNNNNPHLTKSGINVCFVGVQNWQKSIANYPESPPLSCFSLNPFPEDTRSFAHRFLVSSREIPPTFSRGMIQRGIKPGRECCNCSNAEMCAVSAGDERSFRGIRRNVLGKKKQDADYSRRS